MPAGCFLSRALSRKRRCAIIVTQLATKFPDRFRYETFNAVITLAGN
jgi:hypothetical protein